MTQGRHHTAKTKAKISAVLRRHFEDPSVRAKHSEVTKAAMARPEVREKLLARSQRERRRRQPDARAVWEQHHGPVPPEHVIHHRDGNHDNNDITNLACTVPGRHTGYHSSKKPRARRRYADLGPKFSDREAAVIRLLHARSALTAHLIAKALGLGLFTVVQVLRVLHEKNVVFCEVRSNCGKNRWSVTACRLT